MQTHAQTSRNGAVRLRLEVQGIVQGVGFRPYVYQLAQGHGVTGFVRNSSSGALIEVEGSFEAVDEFASKLPQGAPRLAQIVRILHAVLEPVGDSEFRIEQSEAGVDAFTLVSPDISVCEECLAEVVDPADRRYFYPFANCTNCGPRYSIIEDIPYDRAKTTMAEFALCAACRREYDHPANRRFHAQPNACPVCGPRMELAGADGLDARGVLEAVAERLLAGGIVAWKGLGGYQLACDARRQATVVELRRRKRRSEKPFAVMVGDVGAAERLCVVSATERQALTGRERPIVLLRRRTNAGLAEGVSPGMTTVGVMLPCTPMHELLFQVLRERRGEEAALVMTSGNHSEEPIVIDNDAAEGELGEIADAFVHHNRRIHTRVDDSVARVMGDEVMVLRRARGFAPEPVWLGRGDAEVLACGAQQKSTFCLTRAGFALMSQHLGDLENFETLEFYEQTLERMKRLFHANPTVVAHDLHPGYMSTQLAMRLPAERRIAVQHHHAHIASCMAEHHLEGTVIGIAWDGTGLGTDGTIWGGEFLACGYAGFTRYAHLRPVLLAGGDAAVREPWRVGRSYLLDAFDNVIPAGLDFMHSQPGETIRLVDAMLQRRLSTLETSSCGRLFDAMASICGLHPVVSYEGQAAMALEAITAEGEHGQYDFAVEYAIDGHSPAQVDMRPMVREIVEDLRLGKPASQIAARFHNTLTAVAIRVCRQMSNHLGLNRVCVSGGCFQNIRLLEGCVRGLRTEGFEVFFQKRVPTNDGGISLGQAAIAGERLRQGV